LPKNKNKAEKVLIYAGLVHLASFLLFCLEDSIIRGRLGYSFKPVLGFSSFGPVPAVFEKLVVSGT
jgi:hypothetical protein